MTVQALGGYIEGRIVAGKLSRATVQDIAQVRQNYIWKLVQGKIKEPGASTVYRLILAVEGDITLALELLVDENATYRDGYDRGG